MIKKTSFILLGVVLFSALVYSANASHSWGNYHWARTSNPFTLKLGDNLSPVWDAYLIGASSDWSVSSVLDTSVVAGLAGKNCRPTPGRIEVCNKKYGQNGWLGLAQIWVSGDHITQGVTKMNDTYFSRAPYNTPAWKRFVVCQEVGHTFGLDHQDENFSNPNLGSCMDYTNSPDTNQHPNQHDYDELEVIYAHLDAINTSKGAKSSADALVELNDPSAWGKSVRGSSDKRTSLFERDLGKKNKVFTFVVWAD